MEPIMTITDTGFLLTLDGIVYALEWIGGMLKVSGGDVCYYILETVRGIEKANCELTELSILIANN